MKRRNFISTLSLLPLIISKEKPAMAINLPVKNEDIRKYWIDLAYKLAFPVLDALSRRELKLKMPIECTPGLQDDRRKVSHLEAFGRLMSGLSPWFKLEDSLITAEERNLRNALLDLYYNAIISAVDPGSPDYMNFTESNQPLVDIAFLSHAFIRAPVLYEKLDISTKQNLLKCIKATRKFTPGLNNWLLFSAIREAFLLSIGSEYENTPIEFAVGKHLEWYKGDGIYGDGPLFHWDYYNSYVIHPMMLDLLKIISEKLEYKNEILQLEITRAQRYGIILERMISPEGTFPPIGRSLAYRAGAFHLLAQLALNHQLPDSLSPGQVRSALTAVIKKTMEQPSTFDINGWLQIGLSGHQPGIAETYISTGSLYLCTTVLLPLGLPPGDNFWSNPQTDWTSRQLWSGINMGPDHAIIN